MKNSFLLLTAMLFFAGIVSAQTSLRLSTAKGSSASEKSILSRQFKNYEVVTLDKKSSRNLRNVGVDGLIIKTNAIGEINLVAEENKILSEECKAFITKVDGSQEEDLAVKSSKHYSVISKTNSGDIGRFSTFGDKFVLSFTRNGEKWYIEPASNFINDSSNRHVIYSSKDVIEKEGNRCLVTEINDAKVKYKNHNDERVSQNTPYSVKTIRVAIDADYETYTKYKTFANIWIMAVMNQVEEIYWKELKVRIKVVYQNAYSTSNDPYLQTSNSSSALYEFKDYWNANRQNIIRDIAILWTCKSYSDAVGRAFFGQALCNNLSYAYAFVNGEMEMSSQSYVAAHEIGHLIGAEHDPSTGIMFSSVMTDKRSFSTFSKNQINNHIVTKTCFATSSDCSVLGRPGSSFNNPLIVYLSYDNNFYLDKRSNSSDNCYSNFIGQPSNDIYYKVFSSVYGQIKVSHCGSNLDDTYLHQLSSSGTIINSVDDDGPLCIGYKASMKVDGDPGYYYFMSEGYYNSTGEIETIIGLSGIIEAKGTTLNNPIDAGVINGCHSFSDYKNTPNPSFINQYYSESGADDIFYRFSITSPQTITIANCNEYLPFSLYLLDANYNLIQASSAAPVCDYGGYISQNLVTGTYYVVSEIMIDDYPYSNYSINTVIGSSSPCRVGNDAAQENNEYFVVSEPNSEKVVVKYPESDFTRIEFLDMNGKVLSNTLTEQSAFEIPSASIGNGIFIARITQGSSVRNLKFSLLK